MNQCYERYSLPKLIQDEISNLYIPISNIKVNRYINHPTKRTAASDGLIVDSYQTFKNKQENTILYKSFETSVESKIHNIYWWNWHCIETKYDNHNEKEKSKWFRKRNNPSDISVKGSTSVFNLEK